jgi:hypothetical protein
MRCLLIQSASRAHAVNHAVCSCACRAISPVRLPFLCYFVYSMHWPCFAKGQQVKTFEEAGNGDFEATWECLQFETCDSQHPIIPSKFKPTWLHARPHTSNHSKQIQAHVVTRQATHVQSTHAPLSACRFTFQIPHQRTATTLRGTISAP